MQTLMNQIQDFIRNEEGASAVEYGLLVAGIAVAVMTAIYAIGTTLSTKFSWSRPCWPADPGDLDKRGGPEMQSTINCSSLPPCLFPGRKTSRPAVNLRTTLPGGAPG